MIKQKFKSRPDQSFLQKFIKHVTINVHEAFIILGSSDPEVFYQKRCAIEFRKIYFGNVCPGFSFSMNLDLPTLLKKEDTGVLISKFFRLLSVGHLG